MAEPEVAYFRTESGLVLDLHLPLPEVMQHKVTRGQLVRVNADGSTYGASDDVEASADTGAPAATRRPAVNAPKNDWVGHAVSQGMSVDDADAMTKADLIDKFGK